MSKNTLTPENTLLKRVLYTCLVIMVVRFGVHIPVPGVNTKALATLASQQASGGILRILNTFSGGALERFSVFALGVVPYISASIIVQLMTVVVPTLEQWQKEGGSGKQKINRITRLLTVVIALVQGFFFASTVQSAPDTVAGATVLIPGLGFKLLAACFIAAGTCFVLWLGEQITEKGIGNGISIIIFSGIVSGFPKGLLAVIENVKENTLTIPVALVLGIVMILIIFWMCFVEQSYRKIPIHYAKRLVGKNVVQSQATHLPLKMNMAGVIPSIFASTLLGVPVSFARGFGSKKGVNPWLSDLNINQWLYNVLFVVFVMFFCYFYTSIIFKPDDVAENLKKQNAYIPGIRPGTETADALEGLASRLTLAGGIYMNLVILVPVILSNYFSVPFSLGGTSLLIVIGVALETIRQVSAQMATQNYDTLLFDGGSKQKAPSNISSSLSSSEQ